MTGSLFVLKNNFQNCFLKVVSKSFAKKEAASITGNLYKQQTLLK